MHDVSLRRMICLPSILLMLRKIRYVIRHLTYKAMRKKNEGDYERERKRERERGREKE